MPVAADVVLPAYEAYEAWAAARGEPEGRRADADAAAACAGDGCAVLHDLVARTAGFSGAEVGLRTPFYCVRVCVVAGMFVDRVPFHVCGGQVVATVQEAALAALDAGADEVGLGHLGAAADAVTPQITPAMRAFYEGIAAGY